MYFSTRVCGIYHEFPSPLPDQDATGFFYRKISGKPSNLYEADKGTSDTWLVTSRHILYPRIQSDPLALCDSSPFERLCSKFNIYLKKTTRNF